MTHSRHGITSLKTLSYLLASVTELRFSYVKRKKKKKEYCYTSNNLNMHLCVGEFSITTLQCRHEGYFVGGETSNNIEQTAFHEHILFHIMTLKKHLGEN